MLIARRSRMLAVLALAGALAAFPLAVGASHDFADVPNSNVFHADISALAASGVTTGCGGGNYCPSAFVTREQMAAFMNRLGALAPGKVPVVNAAALDGLTSDQFLRSDAVETGAFTCSGATMQPTVDGTDFVTSGTFRQLNSASGWLNCPVLLPDGSTVTAFRAGVYDGSGSSYVLCNLVRGELYSELGASTMASVDSTPAFQSGATMLEDLSIGTPVIDNGQYVYLAECFLSANAIEAVLGVSVEYSVTGLPMP